MKPPTDTHTVKVLPGRPRYWLPSNRTMLRDSLAQLVRCHEQIRRQRITDRGVHHA